MHDDEMMRANQKSQKSERWAWKRRHHHHHHHHELMNRGVAQSVVLWLGSPSINFHHQDFTPLNFVANPT
jgi:hypothetical protein